MSSTNDASSQLDLERAIYEHDIEGIRKAVAAGADPSGTSDDNVIPLSAAVRERSMEMVRLLVEECGASLDPEEGQIHDTSPLGSAVSVGSRELLDYLLVKGARADIDEIYPESTLVGYSAVFNTVKPVDRLERLSMLKTLVEHGADINIRGMHGETPLIRLIRDVKHRPSDDDLAFFRGMIALGADPILKTSEDFPLGEINAFDLASNPKDPRFLDALIECGMDINALDHQGTTLLHRILIDSSWEKLEDSMQRIEDVIARGIDMSIKTQREGFTAFDLIFTGTNPRGKSPLCALLFLRGAPSAIIPQNKLPADFKDNNRLHLAAQAGLVRDVQRLLEEGWDADKINAHGVSPRDLAEAQGHEAICTLMDSWKAKVRVQQILGGTASRPAP